MQSTYSSNPPPPDGSATRFLPPEPTDRELRQIDELVPPLLSGAKQLALGIGLMSAAIVLSVLIARGIVTPNPARGSSFSSNAEFLIDDEQGALGARVELWNQSARDVRLLGDFELDAPGAELVRVDIEVYDGDRREWGAAEVPIVSRTRSAHIEESLQPVRLVVWFRATTCVDGAPPWGNLSARYDFGDGAFPPIARRIDLDYDRIWNGDKARAERAVADGPLALSCGVFQ